ncbi:hypothetical protein J3A83DRAFT_4372019 [Scleroderma citrinum]
MSNPVSLWLALPVETLDLVVECLPRKELLAVIKTNTLFHRIAARVLYRSVSKLEPIQAILLVKTLAHNDFYPSFVRHIELKWSDNTLTANLLRLLNRALRRLKHLLHLTLEFSTNDNASNVASVLWGCTFSLKNFETSMCCGSTLVRFLETQNSITDLCLQGANTIDTIPLPPNALPHLSHFRTVLSPPAMVANFIRGRPIESVSMTLYPGDSRSSLDVLLLSSRRVRRLIVMSFGAAQPIILFKDISARLPWLEALHVVLLSEGYTHEMLLFEMKPSLSRFESLKYLTFMASGAQTSVDFEGAVAALWHKACPTLETIILPRGVIWALTDGKWTDIRC